MTALMDLPGPNGRNMGAAGIAIGTGTALGAPVGGRLYSLGPRAPLLAAAGLLLLVGVAAVRLPEGRLPPPDDRTGVLTALATLRDRPALAVPYAFGFADRFTAGFFALVGTVYIQTRYGLDPAATGMLLGAFFAPFALLQYPFGMLSDQIGRVAPITVGSFAYGLGILAVAVAPTPILAGAVLATVGVFAALCAPATLALVNDLAPGTGRGTATAGFNVAGSLGFLAGIVVGGMVAARVGFTAAFLVAGGSELLLAVGLLPILLRLDTARVTTFTDE